MSTCASASVARDVHGMRLLANNIRHDIIRMLEASGSGHPGGSLSATDIMAALWFSGEMDFNPAEPTDHSRDHFLLSKGHAAPVLYATFHQLGWVTDEDLGTLRQLGSRLQGHPDCHALPGLEICSGSLGQGLSVAAGCALGLAQDDKAASAAEPRRVWCVLGDGEMQEGSNWEAMMFAAHQKLDNLVAILDLNNLQIDGHVTDVCSLGDIEAKWAAFGWNVLTVDGHNIESVLEGIRAAKANAGTGCPTVIICKTVKGKGVSFMEDKASWHGSAPNAEQAAAAIAELDAERERIEMEVSNG